MQNWRDNLQSKTMRNVVVGLFVANGVGLVAVHQQSQQRLWAGEERDSLPVIAAADTAIFSPAAARETFAGLEPPAKLSQPLAISGDRSAQFVPIDVSASSDSAGRRQLAGLSESRMIASGKADAVAGQLSAGPKALRPSRGFRAQFNQAKADVTGSYGLQKPMLPSLEFFDAFASLNAEHSGSFGIATLSNDAAPTSDTAVQGQAPVTAAVDAPGNPAPANSQVGTDGEQPTTIDNAAVARSTPGTVTAVPEGASASASASAEPLAAY